MKKIKIILLVTVIIVSLGASFLMGLNTDKDSLLNEEVSLPKPKHSSFVSMMLETEAGSGQYTLTTSESWPTTGYKFNKNLSRCENGGKVSWDYTSNRVKMEGTSTDKCYIYFDVISTIDNYCTSGESFADCIKNYGDQGSNISDIYIHNSTLTNGAGDGSYRYAGANPNNFVCFGSDANTCPTDNLYRIIGVFGDNNHGVEGKSLVKLIKYDYANSNLLGTDGAYGENLFLKENFSSYASLGGNNDKTNSYYWNNETYRNIWSESNLQNINLNTNYLVNIGTTWANKIATATWKVGGNTFQKITREPINEVYRNEIANPSSDVVEELKIGLLYISEYGYGANSEYWDYVPYDESTLLDYRLAKNNNWLYRGIYEWVITILSNESNAVFNIVVTGNINIDSVSRVSNAVRPTFYLNSDVTYLSGSGTISDPILIK